MTPTCAWSRSTRTPTPMPAGTSAGPWPSTGTPTSRTRCAATSSTPSSSPSSRTPWASPPTVGGDAQGVLELGELLGVDEVAAQRVLEVGVPVDGHGPADVPAGIGVGVLVDLDHAQVGVIQVGGQPVGGDQQLITIGHGVRMPPRAARPKVRKRPRLGSGPPARGDLCRDPPTRRGPRGRGSPAPAPWGGGT